MEWNKCEKHLRLDVTCDCSPPPPATGLVHYTPCLNGSAFAGMFSRDGLYRGKEYNYYLAADVDALLDRLSALAEGFPDPAHHGNVPLPSAVLDVSTDAVARLDPD